MLNGDSAAREWDDLAEEEFRHTVACRVEDSWLVDGGALSRGRRLALAAAGDAVNDADLALPKSTGVYIGSTMGESAAFEAAAREGDRERDLRDETVVAFPRFIREALGLSGPAVAYGTACAAGNYALGAAADALRRGDIDAALAGGVEPFSRIAMTGFSRSRAMSSSGVCRPFDNNHDGMLVGEGAAVMVLEREADARARGAGVLGAVGALGLTCDAYHPTAPKPDSSGAAAAYWRALGTEGLAPGDIQWICAHGTGTPQSDGAEARAVTSVFGDTGPPITALKGAFGHAMGAASAIEAAICLLALKHGVLPASTGLIEPEFPLDHVITPRKATPAWIANAGFAFGGLNSVLLLGAP